MLRNEVVLVDINDKEIREENKKVAHSKPLLHRAFSVFLYNDKGELLIQKRAINKYHSGGLWANACCSHPKKGENIKLSAMNRLTEELGISVDVKELFSFIYLNKFNEHLFEYELDHVFLGKYNGEIKLNLEEATEVKWIKLEDLKNELVNNPQNFASWFIICAPRVIEYLQK